MSQNDNIEVPNLGPADGERPNGTAPVSAPVASAAPVAAASAGGSVLPTIISLVLALGVGGVGYFSWQLDQKLAKSEQQLGAAEQRIGELEKLLDIANDSVTESGQSLKSQLQGLAAANEEKQKYFEQEIAKLRTISSQKNSPKLVAQEKQLAELSAQQKELVAKQKDLTSQQQALVKQQKAVKGVGDSIKAMGGELEKLKADLKKQQTALANLDKKAKQQPWKKPIGQLEAKQREALTTQQQVLADVEKSVAALDTRIQILDEEQAGLVGTDRELTDKLNTLEQKAGKGSGNLEGRVRVNEQAIQAIDGTRRQLNRELLQVRKKLNNLQLQLESR